MKKNIKLSWNKFCSRTFYCCWKLHISLLAFLKIKFKWRYSCNERGKCSALKLFCKIIAVKTTYIESESLTLAAFQLNAILKICKLAYKNKNLQTNFEYIIFENNHSATEGKCCVHAPIWKVDFLFLSSILWNGCVPWIMPSMLNGENPACLFYPRPIFVM